MAGSGPRRGPPLRGRAQRLATLFSGLPLHGAWRGTARAMPKQLGVLVGLLAVPAPTTGTLAHSIC